MIEIQKIEVDPVNPARGWIITAVRRTGMLWWRRSRGVQFIGEGTVWYDRETGRRCSTHLESWLTEVAWWWSRQRRERELFDEEVASTTLETLRRESQPISSTEDVAR